MNIVYPAVKQEAGKTLDSFPVGAVLRSVTRQPMRNPSLYLKTGHSTWPLVAVASGALISYTVVRDNDCFVAVKHTLTVEE